MALADHVVVNDDLEQTIKEMLAIIEAVRAEPGAATGRGQPGRSAGRGPGR